VGWLAVNTSADWGFSIDITANAATATYTSAGTETNAVEAMDALVLWANNAARPWFGFNAFAWSARSGDTGRAEMVLASGDFFDFVPDATALATLGIAAQNVVLTTAASTGASGGWYPGAGVYLRRWLGKLGNGDAAGIGSLRPGVPGSAGLSSRVQAIAGYAEVESLQVALRAATQPRTGQIYGELSASWVEVALGGKAQTRLGTQHYQIEIAALGEVA
jgi:hypothetical protein